MEFALKDGLRSTAEPGLKAECAHCGAGVIARCGTKNCWHWAHASGKSCDTWYEPETEWHRHWKALFGIENSEIKITKEDCFHIADVFKNDIVFEFQNSPLSSEEIFEREQFYGERMLWIINGAPFQKNFEFYDEEFKKNFHLSVTNEFEAATRYGKHPAQLVIEDLWVKNEKVKTLLTQYGFIYEAENKIYCRQGTMDRQKLYESIKTDLLKLHKENSDRSVSVAGTFDWKHPRRSWENCKRPVFIDFGEDCLYRITSGMGYASGEGLRINKQKFINKYSGA